MTRTITLMLVALVLVACAPEPQDPRPRQEQDRGPATPAGDRGPSLRAVTEATPLNTVMEAGEFDGFGDLVLPSAGQITPDMTVADTAKLLPYHSGIRPSEVAGTLNDLLDGVRSGSITFHHVYGDEEVEDDPAKADVGLFFFKGKADAPFAIVAPGGGFSYVGSIHEGFPYARAIAERGFNAFVIHYRTGDGGQPATEDLARAINFVFENREALGVNTDGYSLWGSSAGARMAANLGSYGTASFGASRHPRPNTVVIAYTGHADYTENDPPTFAIVGSNDGIASPTTMEERIRRLDRAGVDTEFRRLDGIGHGFGLGTGTVAEGWVDDAVDFWEAHR